MPGGFNHPNYLPPTSGMAVSLRFLFYKRKHTWGKPNYYDRNIWLHSGVRLKVYLKIILL